MAASVPWVVTYLLIYFYSTMTKLVLCSYEDEVSLRFKKSKTTYRHRSFKLVPFGVSFQAQHL